jgi:hypothetical protein
MMIRKRGLRVNVGKAYEWLLTGLFEQRGQFSKKAGNVHLSMRWDGCYPKMKKLSLKIDKNIKKMCGFFEPAKERREILKTRGTKIEKFHKKD